VPRLTCGRKKKSSRENAENLGQVCAQTAGSASTMLAMTRKPRPAVTILFLAILPIGAWLAVIYFCLVMIGATTFSIELFSRLLTLT
jgi:hypothetical protein